MEYLTRAMGLMRMSGARSPPVVRTSPRRDKPGKVTTAARRSDPPIVRPDGDSYADYVLCRARANRRTTFATRAAEAKWAYHVLAQELMGINRQLHWADLNANDELVIRQVELQVRMGMLSGQYAREWHR